MNRRRAVALIGGVVLSGAACTIDLVRPPIRPGCGPGIAAEEDAIRDAALRFLFAKNADAEPVDDRFLMKYYVGIVQKTSQPVRSFFDSSTLSDPSPSLLARLSQNNPVVMPVSEAPTYEATSWPRSGMWDHLFTLGDMCWTGNNEIEIRGGRRPRFPSDTPYLMKVARSGGHWVVGSYEYTGGR